MRMRKPTECCKTPRSWEYYLVRICSAHQGELRRGHFRCAFRNHRMSSFYKLSKWSGDTFFELEMRLNEITSEISEVELNRQQSYLLFECTTGLIDIDEMERKLSCCDDTSFAEWCLQAERYSCSEMCVCCLALN